MRCDLIHSQGSLLFLWLPREGHLVIAPLLLSQTMLQLTALGLSCRYILRRGISKGKVNADVFLLAIANQRVSTILYPHWQIRAGLCPQGLANKTIETLTVLGKLDCFLGLPHFQGT